MTQSDKERMEALAEKYVISLGGDKDPDYKAVLHCAREDFKKGYLAAREEPSEREKALVEAATKALELMMPGDNDPYKLDNDPDNFDKGRSNLHIALKAYEDERKDEE